MKLTIEEKSILKGDKGPILKKIMKVLVAYGDAIGADRLVDIEGPGHLAIPWALHGVGPRIELLKELTESGLKTKYPFTIDPRIPQDFENLKISKEQEMVFKNIFRNQNEYDWLINELGLRDKNAYTCTPYLHEVNNIPKRGEILSWAESSCIVFANSVLGAKTNRTATIMDLLSNIMGKVPLAGFLTEEGRKATWLVDVKTSKLPNPQLLGGAIGRKVLEDVPYIIGLDKFLEQEINNENIDYLKEMGAVCAAIGAVGLFHVEGITPEAVDNERLLLKDNFKTYIIDDQELKSLFESYPIMWQNPNSKPKKCLIGCPHLSLQQLYWWSEKICQSLEENNLDCIDIDTVLCAAPQVIEKVRKDNMAYKKLIDTGVLLSSTCAEMYMNNHLCAIEPVITNSNKLRAFTTARMFLDEELVDIIVNGNIRVYAPYYIVNCL